MRSRRAFTLLELLVVVAAFVILAVLSLASISTSAGKAKRITCSGNLRAVNLGVRMYCDDSRDVVSTPAFTSHESNLPWNGYKQLMKTYAGLKGESSRNRLFACPEDVFYYEPGRGWVPESRYEQAFSDFSSYMFNAADSVPSPPGLGRHLFLGIAERRLSSIRNSARTVLVAEAPAFQPYSWHNPKLPKPDALYPEVLRFNNARDMLSFVDGHVDYARIFWNSKLGIETCCYDPPAGYDYQWSGD